MGCVIFSLYRDMTDAKHWLATYFPEKHDLTMVPDFPHLVEAVKQLDEYLAGERSQFTLPLDLRGTISNRFGTPY